MTLNTRVKRLERMVADKHKPPAEISIHINPCFDCDGCEDCEAFREEVAELKGYVIHVNGED